MSIFAHDTFESYAVGTKISSIPTYIKSGFGDGTIVAGGWNSNNALRLDADVGIGQRIVPIKGIDFAAYLFAGNTFQSEKEQIFQCINTDGGSQNQIIAFASVESNGAISVYAADGSIMCTTGLPGNNFGSTYVPFNLDPFYVVQNNWFYLLLSFQFGTWLDGSSIKLTCGCNVFVNGTEYNTGSIFSQVIVGSLPTPLPVVNAWNSQGIGGIGTLMDNLYVSDVGGYGEPFFPPDKIPVRVSQTVVEYAAGNLARKIRASQLVTEVILQPDIRRIRASQLVVEVMGKGTAIASDGMKVREI